MKVRIITKETIWSYCRKNARSQSSFYVFLEKIENCSWEDLNQIKVDFPNMSIVGDCERNRVIFNVGGNRYRVICDYNFYNNCCLYIAFIGTHAEYDKVDACRVQMY